MGWSVIPALVGVEIGPLLIKDVLNFLTGLVINPLIGLTLAVIWWRLRRPRPSWPALFRQPGFVACVTAPLAFLLFLEANYLGAQIKSEFAIGVSILTAWALLAIGRRWVAERGWVDRLGRLAGTGWIIVAVRGMIERLI